jgi:hypothetical protein
MTVTKLTAEFYTAGTALNKFAIYADSSSYPGALKAQSESKAAPGTGWQDYSLTSNVYLASGSYWFCWRSSINSNSFLYGSSTGGTFYYGSGSSGVANYAAAWPDPAPAGATAETWILSWYATGVAIEGYVKGYKFQYTGPGGLVSSFSFYTTNDGSLFRLALYNDNGASPSKPNQLLWSCGDQTPNAGNWVTVQRTSGTDANGWNHALITNNWYWLMYQWNSTTSGPSYTAGTSNFGCYIVQAYGAFPDPGTSATNSAEEWSQYLTWGADASISESSPATDLLSRQATYSRTIIATSPTTDLVSRQATYPRSILDSSSITDLVLKLTLSVISDSTQTIDALSRQVSYVRTILSSSTVIDLLSAAYPFVAVVSEQISVTDLLSRQATYSRTIIATSPTTDLVSRQLTYLRTISDLTVATDVLSRTATYARTISERLTKVVDIYYIPSIGMYVLVLEQKSTPGLGELI